MRHACNWGLWQLPNEGRLAIGRFVSPFAELTELYRRTRKRFESEAPCKFTVGDARVKVALFSVHLNQLCCRLHILKMRYFSAGVRATFGATVEGFGAFG